MTSLKSKQVEIGRQIRRQGQLRAILFEAFPYFKCFRILTIVYKKGFLVVPFVIQDGRHSRACFKILTWWLRYTFNRFKRFAVLKSLRKLSAEAFSHENEKLKMATQIWVSFTLGLIYFKKGRRRVFLISMVCLYFKSQRQSRDEV